MNTLIFPLSIQQQISRIDTFTSIDSTNSFLLNNPLAKQDKGFAVCCAHEQTQGRGRQGKHWFSPEGNIYLSIGFRCSQPLSTLSSLSLVVGVLLAEALGEFGIVELQLKWPNDLFYKDRKLSGILVETLFEDEELWVVIGIGLNVKSNELIDQVLLMQSISLEEITADSPPSSSVIAKLLEVMINQIPLYLESGFPLFFERWKKHDYLRGKLVEVSYNTLTQTGQVCGVDSSGALLLAQGEEIQAITNGTIKIL